MRILNFTLFLFFGITIISCNNNKLKERELSIRERELTIKEKELGLDSNDTTIANNPIVNRETPILSMKEIIAFAKKHFAVYKSKLEYKGVAIGIDDAYTGDFTGDGKEDVVIYYDLEPTDGGNYMAGQGLVLYKNIGNDAVFINKYEPKYQFSFDKINNGNIYISQDDYKEDDAHCCPSIHTIMELTVTGNKISEHKK